MTLEESLDEAETKAWDSLRRYKFPNVRILGGDLGAPQ